jgi:hypothetical protein
VSRDINDPRVQKILGVLEGWSKSNSPDQVGRFVEQIFERINIVSLTADEARPFALALIDAADEDLLDAFAEEAEHERETLLQCTIGNDITHALRSIGLNGAQAEQIAHKAIAEALATQAVAP